MEKMIILDLIQFPAIKSITCKAESSDPYKNQLLIETSKDSEVIMKA